MDFLVFNIILNEGVLYLDTTKIFSGQKIVKYKDKIVFYYNCGDFKKCLSIVNKLLLKDKSAFAYMYKARCYKHLGELEKALKNIERAQVIDMSGEMYNYSYWKANCLYEFNRYEQALKYINEAIIFNADSESYTIKGLCLMNIGEYKQALNVFFRAIDTAKYDTKDVLYWGLALTYYHLGDFNNALHSINRSLLYKKDSENYILKGDILSALNKISDAKINYDKANLISAG